MIGECCVLQARCAVELPVRFDVQVRCVRGESEKQKFEDEIVKRTWWGGNGFVFGFTSALLLQHLHSSPNLKSPTLRSKMPSIGKGRDLIAGGAAVLAERRSSARTHYSQGE